jgi:hypothetical protein
LACEADARQALLAFAQDVPVTFLATSTVRATPRDDTRGRPGKSVPPDPMVYHIDGALASALTPRQTLMDQPSCVLLATNELDATPLTPQELLEGDKGQGHAARGFRFLKDPHVLASSLYLTKPARIMALVMVMTVVCSWMRLWHIAYAKRSKTMRRPFPTKKANGFTIRRHGGCCRMLWAFTCGVRQANGRWC